MRRRSMILVVLLALVAASCGDDSSTTAPTTTTPTTTTAPTTSAPATTTTAAPATTTTAASTTTVAPASTTSTPAEGTHVLVYLVTTDAPVVAASGRQVTGDDLPLAAMEALLAGPDDLDTEIGYHSEIPDGTRVHGVSVEDGEATVDLSATFESGGGSASMLARVAQVVFTLTQFPEIDEVDFAIDGTTVEAIGGEGVLVDGLDRDDLEALSPIILVEAPTPGDEVGGEIRIAGTANTFEATVQYAVTDPDGLILDEGFFTATSGSGTRGTFEHLVSVTPDRAGLGAVIVWEESAQDGSRINLVEIPVRMGAS